MKITGYKVKNQKALGIFAAAVVVGMFLLRYILLSNGTIDAMYTLDEESLYAALEAYEVTVSADSGDGTAVLAGGTILDGRKLSSGDDDYTLTIVTSLAATGAEEETELTVTLPDGTQAEGTRIAYNESVGYALIQCLCPEELEVYYSRDILYRLAEEDPVYVLASGEVIAGMVSGTDIDEEEWGEGLLMAEMEGQGSSDSSSSDASDASDAEGSFASAGIPDGCGLYGKSGNYLGMVLTSQEDGTLYAVPGDVIMAALNAVL